MKIFVNKSGNVTAIDGQVVYQIPTGSLRNSFEIVETWLRGGDNVEFGATDQQRAAAHAIKVLIRSDCFPGNKSELEKQDSDALRMFNGNVNPTGRAGSSQWAIGR